jgi:hypothetical protein
VKCQNIPETEPGEKADILFADMSPELNKPSQRYGEKHGKNRVKTEQENAHVIPQCLKKRVCFGIYRTTNHRPCLVPALPHVKSLAVPTLKKLVIPERYSYTFLNMECFSKL